MRLFASELLEASLNIDEKESFTFSKDWNHNNSDFNISRIEFLEKTRLELNSIEREEHKKTWKEIMFGYMFGGVLFLS